MSKCAECASGVNVKAYCVECKKVLCRRCIGRLHFPGLRSADHTIEELDKDHDAVQSVAVYILNTSVVIGAIVALWHSGIQEDYFRGASTCPSLGWGREILARFDTNVFYYYKSTLATACDVEDSFWRLLMDGWTRGVVTGSDSYLLLLSTLPKALAFKAILSKFLKPVYAVFYALMATVMIALLSRFEDAFEHAASAASATGRGKKVVAALTKILRAPSELKARITTQSTWPSKAWKLFVALGCSGCLRMAFHTAGFYKLAALDTAAQRASTWQLTFEPFCFFMLAHLSTQVDKKLNKHLYVKKGKPVAKPVITLFRRQPRRDMVELMKYTQERTTRTFNYYRSQAEDILHVLVDDTFNFVVMARLLGITFGLSGVFRVFLKICGLGGLVQRHGLWYTEATGLEAETMFLSDRIFQLLEKELLWGFGKVGSTVVSIEGLFDIWSLGTLVSTVWRAALPMFLYFLETKWEKSLKTQQGDFKKKWQGASWLGGAYMDCQKDLGSFWMEVPQDQWEPMKSEVNPPPKPRAAQAEG